MRGPAPDFGALATTYKGELDSLKRWIGTRLQWLDAKIQGLCVPAGVAQPQSTASVNRYPNPTKGALTMVYVLSAEMDVVMRIFNSQGAEVWSMPRETSSAGKHAFSLETASLATGIYMVKFEVGVDVFVKKVVVME